MSYFRVGTLAAPELPRVYVHCDQTLKKTLYLQLSLLKPCKLHSEPKTIEANLDKRTMREIKALPSIHATQHNFYLSPSGELTSLKRIGSAVQTEKHIY